MTMQKLDFSGVFVGEGGGELRGVGGGGAREDCEKGGGLYLGMNGVGLRGFTRTGVYGRFPEEGRKKEKMKE